MSLILKIFQKLPSRQPNDVDIISMSILYRNRVGHTMSTNQPIFEFASTEGRRLGINFKQPTSNRCLNYVLGSYIARPKVWDRITASNLCRINDTFSRLCGLDIIYRDLTYINTKLVVDPYFIHTNLHHHTEKYLQCWKQFGKVPVLQQSHLDLPLSIRPLIDSDFVTFKLWVHSPITIPLVKCLSVVKR